MDLALKIIGAIWLTACIVLGGFLLLAWAIDALGRRMLDEPELDEDEVDDVEPEEYLVWLERTWRQPVKSRVPRVPPTNPD